MGMVTFFTLYFYNFYLVTLYNVSNTISIANFREIYGVMVRKEGL